MRPEAAFELAKRLRQEGAPLGEVFSFMSGLYFRGKLTYASTFAAPPPGVPGTLIITSSRGLVPATTSVKLPDLHALAAVPIDDGHPQYVQALKRDAELLQQKVSTHCQFVLLGSVATPKYVLPLVDVLGERLVFPTEFIGRGDLSRGGLLLRCARERKELAYSSVGRATRHGPRPPKLLASEKNVSTAPT